MRLHYKKQALRGEVQLPASKSISNRLLMLKESLCPGLSIDNLSTARDTQVLIEALGRIRAGDTSIDIGDAGTAFRFLTAYLAVHPGSRLLTGSQRIQERPIRQLVEALRELGAQIEYAGKDGYAPLHITGKKIPGGHLEIDTSISSQFVSALLLVAPLLDKGLSIRSRNKVVSASYIRMTIGLLRQLGASCTSGNNEWTCKRTNEASRPIRLQVEADWSSASYWYSFCALAPGSRILLKGLHENSLQGDAALPEIYASLGVSTAFVTDGITIAQDQTAQSLLEYDFNDCPDLAQTVAVTCAGLGTKAKLSGLSTLKDKETNRLQAMKNELEKFGTKVRITADLLEILSSELPSPDRCISVNTYQDHRMAMCFAPLVTCCDIEFNDAGVVAKSYPGFWEDLSRLGVECRS